MTMHKQNMTAMGRADALCWATIVVLAASVTAPPAFAEPGCQRVRLQETLSFIGSAVWSAGKSPADAPRILATNPMTGSTIAISKEGKKSTAHVPAALALSKIGDDYLRFTGRFFRGQFQIHWLDENLNELGVIDFSKMTSFEEGIGNSYRLLAPYDWTIAGDTLIGYGVMESGSAGIFGFFSHQLVLPGSGIVPKIDLIMPFANFDFYMLGHPTITSVGEVAYFLYMDSHPTLFRFDTRSSLSPAALDGFPGENTLLPHFQTASRPPNEVFMEIEGFDGVPVGLFSQGGLLYSLAREKAHDGRSTLWTLTQMRPRLDDVEVLGTMELPTSASHISLLFGPESLVLFEKGTVEEDGTQDILEMLIISGSWIKDPVNSPLYSREGKSVECVRVDHPPGG